MKSLLLTFIFAVNFSSVCGQTDRFNLSVEYSPNFSSITHEYFHFHTGHAEGFRFANNLFAKVEYLLIPDLYATASIGMLQTSELVTLDENRFHEIANKEIDKLELDYTHYYLVTPVGVTYYFRSFYISPEIGIGWSIHNRLKYDFYYTDGSGSEFSEDLDRKRDNEVTYPLFLSIGHEISMKTYSILIGLKGYYSLNPQVENYYEKWHYYGFGAVTGLRF